MNSLEELKKSYRNEARLNSIEVLFSKDNLSFTTKEGRDSYKTTATVCGSIIQLTSQVTTGGGANYSSLTLHARYWMDYAKIFEFLMIQLDSCTAMIKHRAITQKFVEAQNWRLFVHHDKANQLVYYVIHKESPETESLFKYRDKIYSFWNSFLKENKTASLSSINEEFYFPSCYRLRWHGTEIEIICHYTKDGLTTKTRYLDISHVDIEEGWKQTLKGIESKFRLQNLMNPTYIHLRNFLIKIGAHSPSFSTFISSLIGHLKTKGWDDEKIETTALEASRVESVSNKYLRSYALNNLQKQITSKIYAFTFGDLFIHMSSPISSLFPVPLDIISQPDKSLWESQVSDLLSNYARELLLDKLKDTFS